MVSMPLAHISWALPDNALRPACDAFFLDVFGARSVHEMLITPETEKLRLDREERLMLVGDTMVIPIAPAGLGCEETSPLGTMLRRSAAPMRWIGVALRVADLEAADAWFRAKGFSLHYDPGMEKHYFLISRYQALGVRIEVMQAKLPDDPRLEEAWSPAYWSEEHPLGIEGLQSIGISAPNLDEARAIFADKFEWPEINARKVVADYSADGAAVMASCAAFLMGDTVLETLAPENPEHTATPLAQHLQNIKGIYSLTFKVKSAQKAADYLRGLGFDLQGTASDRFAIVPSQAQDRLIWFTEHTPQNYPLLGTKMREPAIFPKIFEAA